MSIRSTTKSVVRDWASIPSVTNTLTELCVLWAQGNSGQPCGPALQPLIDDLKQAFPTKNLGGLRPSDMMGGGSVKTVEALIAFIASSPSKALPFTLVTTSALKAFVSTTKTPKKDGSKTAKKSSKKKPSKHPSKAGKAGGGKAGGKGSKKGSKKGGGK